MFGLKKVRLFNIKEFFSDLKNAGTTEARAIFWILICLKNSRQCKV